MKEDRTSADSTDSTSPDDAGRRRVRSATTRDDGMRTRVDVETMRATRNGAARVAAREARSAHRGGDDDEDDDEDDDAVVSAFVAKEAMDAHAERIRGALARVRGYDRGRRGGGVAYDPRDRPTCVITDVKSALRALVPGEALYAPRRAVERFTVGAANGETRARQLVAYARSIDRGLGLEGWDETRGEDPATAFRDGAASVVAGGGAPARMDTGLVVFTGDASHFTVAQDLDVLGVVGVPGAYQRGRSAIYGGVGTLCQWMFRNQNGHQTRRANAEDDAFTRTCGADDPDVVEFRAISLVWCGFPADFNFRESTNRADAHRDDEPIATRLTPSAWLDTDVCSGLDVYSLGVETISESRIRDARKLMSRIIEALRARDAGGNRDDDGDGDDAWRGLSWDEIEETLPRGARHPTKFSFWIMHFVPCLALDDDFRWLLLSTDDTVSRLSLILERIKLEKFFWRGAHVPVVHECGHVLTETRMARPLASHAFGSCGRSRAHDDEGGEKFPSSVITRVLFNPNGFYSRYCVFASDPPKSTDVEEPLRDVWARYEDFLGRSSLDYTTDVYVENDVSHGDYSWFKGYKWCPVTCPRCECSCGFRFSRDDNPVASPSPLREWPRRHAPRSLDKVAFYVFFYIAPYWGAATGAGMTDVMVTHFLHGDTASNIIFDECDGDFAEQLRIQYFHPCVDYGSDDDDGDDDGDDDSDEVDESDDGDDDDGDDDDGDDDGDENTRSDSDSVEFDD